MLHAPLRRGLTQVLEPMETDVSNPPAKNESPAIWAFFQITYTCIPLILLAFALFIFGSFDSFWRRPDIAFIALIFGADALKDAFALDRLRGLGNIAADSAVVYLIILLLLAAAPLFIVLGIEAGKVSIPLGDVTPFSVASIFLNGAVCFVIKYFLKRKRNELGL